MGLPRPWPGRRSCAFRRTVSCPCSGTYGRPRTGGQSCRSGRSRAQGYDSGSVRRYHVTTFGCQMNAHDSERIKGMLEELGLGEAPGQEEADVLVFNTCTIREKPDTKFAAH